MWSDGKRTSWIIAAALFFLLAATGDGQIIENPAKPKAANAGRVITPQEVLVISDAGTSDYYFKWPHALAAGPDGSLLLLDVEQVLRFSQNGRFLGNLFKKGQGPGEIGNASACLAVGPRLVIHSPRPNKLVYFDSSGKFEKELPVRRDEQDFLRALFFQSPAVYMKSTEFPRTSGNPDIVDRSETIIAVDAATAEARTLATFVTKAFVVTGGGGAGMIDIVNLIVAPFQDRLIAVVHTEDYLIKIFEPSANKVVRGFRRAYPRVKGEPLTEAEKKGGIIINDKHYTRPERKFENDVKNLLTRAGEIWAVTSTKDEVKGLLIDVFDGEGVYRDCFWLKLPEPALGSVQSPGQCALDGQFLWVVERAEDETFSIKKYGVASSQARGTVPLRGQSPAI
jgi:hypothetical protein